MRRTSQLTIAFGACTIVAISTIWGWFTDEPIDITGPARAAVNRTDYVSGYAVNVRAAAADGHRSRNAQR